MAIFYNERTKTFYLDGKGISYVFYINDYGYAEHLYYGKSIAHDDIFFTRGASFGDCECTPPANEEQEGIWSYNRMGSEFTFFGTGDFRESTLHMTDSVGNRAYNFTYRSHRILDSKPKISGMPSLDGGETLLLELCDGHSGFVAELYYTVYDDCGIIARRAVYKNETGAPITLGRAFSFAMTLPEGDYDMLTLWGGWANERQQDRLPIRHGINRIDSKRGSSSASLNPFMALMPKDTTELAGDAYAVSLIYSSSFALFTERNTSTVLIGGGINDADFSWQLAPGEAFETPEVMIAYSDEGLSGMSRQLHDAMRYHLINKRYVNGSRPIVINNWEATYFNFTNEKLIAIVDAVAGCGIDTFVLDDGWFGKRDTPHSGLGDWVVNEGKLAGGLKTVIDHVHSKGMRFGLWFEPEMISEDSDVFRAHPDYAIGVPGRDRCYGRFQFLMDLTRADVRDYIVGAVNRILAENDIDYVKWDYNRHMTEFYSAALTPSEECGYAHRYAIGVYDLFERIVEANPNVFFEGCSSGGSRFDPAVLHYFPQIWTSDNSDAEDRTSIQYGTSFAYPLSTMSCHVSATPNHQVGRVTPMRTRADIAHLGATGYELDTSSFTDEDRATIRQQVEEYKSMEELVLHGDLYRLKNPKTDGELAFLVVSRDKARAHLTAYRRLNKINAGVSRVRLAGLDPEKKYHCPELNVSCYGSTLMGVGIALHFDGCDFATETLSFYEDKS